AVAGRVEIVLDRVARAGLEGDAERRLHRAGRRRVVHARTEDVELVVDGVVVGGVVVEDHLIRAGRDRAADVRVVDVAHVEVAVDVEPGVDRLRDGRVRPGYASEGEARNEHHFAHHKAAASRSTPASISSGAANAYESRSALETAPKRVPSHAVTPSARFSTSRPSG